ncbi:flagellar biosynthesis protein FlgE [Marinobacter sp. X15-166B]|uniref:flagellar biosynthesis protein FlgE n=1 Tax=Marinobacter sp. X15-166B TaxID=1897620 RepID=UPI00085CBADA|nr:flagellar biosynthesis protein FlgE [Marinobacter sp. X15-166B]OEY65231.1 flagellar biosynthesis protein FlgE [Marinobacter sp. X15-166B]
MINNTLSVGLQGLQNSVQGMESAARRIAHAGSAGPEGATRQPGGLLEPVMDLKLYERHAEASARVIRTADETLGSLLDIMV